MIVFWPSATGGQAWNDDGHRTRQFRKDVLFSSVLEACPFQARQLSLIVCNTQKYSEDYSPFSGLMPAN
jgi:hypothetical protein